MTKSGTDGEAQQWARFGEWLRDEREAQGLSRDRLEEQSGVSSSTIANLERGGRRYKGDWQLPSPTDDKLVRLADGLAVDPGELFRRAGRELSEKARAQWERRRREQMLEELRGRNAAEEQPGRHLGPRVGGRLVLDDDLYAWMEALDSDDNDMLHRFAVTVMEAVLQDLDRTLPDAISETVTHRLLEIRVSDVIALVSSSEDEGLADVTELRSEAPAQPRAALSNGAALLEPSSEVLGAGRPRGAAEQSEDFQ